MMIMVRFHKKLTFWLVALVLLLSSSWIFYYLFAHASALSFVCSSSAASTSTAACSGEQSGDLLLVMAGESSGGAAPSLATGFNNITTLTNSAGSSSTQTGMRVGWSTAASSSTGSGTWTSATDVVMLVYRGQGFSPIGANFGTESGSNSGTSVSFNSDTLSVTDGSSWFAAFALRNTADTKLNTAPTGMTKRTSIPATPAAAGYDLNGPTSSNWSLASVTGFSASAKYTSIVLEIKAAPNITVGTFGSQVSSMTIPSTGNFVGGAFTFLRDIGTANITSIKITEIGTVNATSNLTNLVLYYKQEASCESTFPSSGTTQFNSTTGSFILVSGTTYTSTVTGTMAVGTSQVCVYAKVDVGSGASPGDTVIMEIADPVSDTLVSAGSVNPSTAVTLGGTTTLEPPGPTTDQVMRGGEWFSGGTKQPFFWAQ